MNASTVDPLQNLTNVDPELKARYLALKEEQNQVDEMERQLDTFIAKLEQ